MSALLAVCPACRGDGSVCIPTSTVEGYDGPYTCGACGGAGTLEVLCDHPRCETPATRRSVGEPAVAYCQSHDLCPLCESAPAGPDDYCARCARDLAVVDPEAVGATA